MPISTNKWGFSIGQIKGMPNKLATVVCLFDAVFYIQKEDNVHFIN